LIDLAKALCLCVLPYFGFELLLLCAERKTVRIECIIVSNAKLKRAPTIHEDEKSVGVCISRWAVRRKEPGWNHHLMVVKLVKRLKRW
jgi:hypothetical protein